MGDKFTCKNGHLTAYALANGYIDKSRYGTMYRENGVYTVSRKYKQYYLTLSFNTLGVARRFLTVHWSNFLKLIAATGIDLHDMDAHILTVILRSKKLPTNDQDWVKSRPNSNRYWTIKKKESNNA